MYAALWRVLPGPIWVRIILVAILLVAVLFVLATWVYPWIDGILNNQEAMVGSP
jgi:membrane protein implicated in regulation of membrane protease activity